MNILGDPVSFGSWCFACAMAVGGLALVHGPGDESSKTHDRDHGGHGQGGLERWLPRLEDPARDEWQKPDTVVAILGLEPGMTVVDVGAGTGYFLSRLDHAVAPDGAVIALDVDPELIDYMRKRAAREGLTRVSARLVSADDPGLEPESVDRILVVNTWHHLPNRDVYAARLAEALRVGGMIVVIDPTLDGTVGPPPEHRLPAETVVAELTSAGLDAAIVLEQLPQQYAIVGRRR